MAPSSGQRPVHVLYVVYWGAVEPLGQALVLPAVRRLSELGVRITLVTFEKPEDMERAGEMRHVRALLEEAGVRWRPLRYHKRPKVPATAFDFSHGMAKGIVERLRERPDVVHGRTFVGGLIALATARLTGARLVFHNEGFYPDEQVDAGVWTAGSFPHRLAKRLERHLYTHADAVFSTSRGGKEIIRSIDGVRRRGTPVIVVPSCVDLEHFSPRERSDRKGHVLKLIYVGSVGGRYLVDQMGRFAHVARLERPETELEVVTHSEPALVQDALGRSGLPNEAWTSRFVPYESLPDELARQQAGLCFHPRGLASAGGSPTKIGEYWAMGLPVVATAGMADVDDIVQEERVGVTVTYQSDEAYRTAFRALLELMEDPDLADRCRAAAERHYGLAAACDRQLEVYEALLGS